METSCIQSVYIMEAVKNREGTEKDSRGTREEPVKTVCRPKHKCNGKNVTM